MSLRDFGWAVQALKEGKEVTRSGWNGKGMYLFLDRHPVLHPIEFPATKFAQEQICPVICMRAADGSIVAWLASQTDVLAEDWTFSAPCAAANG